MQRPSPHRLMRRRRWLVFAVLAAVGLASLLAWSRQAPTEEIGLMTFDPAWPQETLADLVTYADQVSVVTVRSEDALPVSADHRASGSGLLGREVTLVVERTIWKRPDAPSVERSVTTTTLGWMLRDGVAYPIHSDDGSARLEVNGRYVAALARVNEEDGSTAWAAYAVLPLHGDVVRPGEGQTSVLLDSFAGRNVDALAAELADTEPDARAVEFAHLDPIERWAAVSGAGARGPTSTEEPLPRYPSDEELADARPCEPSAVRELAERFVSAFNEGDAASADTMLARPPIFQWYSANRPGERFGAEAQNRETLVTYFAKRHAAGEQLRLAHFKFNGNSAGFGHFQFRVTRRADDFRNGREFTQAGKGAAFCTETSEVIAVWSM